MLGEEMLGEDIWVETLSEETLSEETLGGERSVISSVNNCDTKRYKKNVLSW